MKEQYEQIKFDTWQELAKYVIDGGEVYFGDDKELIKFRCGCFNYDMELRDFYIKKQPTLQELIAIKPRLCWAWQVDETEKYVVAISSCNDLYGNGVFVLE